MFCVFPADKAGCERTRRFQGCRDKTRRRLCSKHSLKNLFPESCCQVPTTSL
ncbi:unnamed protein product [Larinioides sclopetarius]|uniref:Uncharacterized protein n=1 Tax=Larinioides sclopetarius TaxID=280406 RepID=A0AAV2BLH3_9ARAC